MGEMFNGFGQAYNQATISTDESVKVLEPGGYVLKILKVSSYTTKKGYPCMLVNFDIAEGDFKDYFKKKWNVAKNYRPDAKWSGTAYVMLPAPNDDRETVDKKLSRLKGFITAVNESNGGKPIDAAGNFSSDEFTNKLVGGLFGSEEYAYNGKQGWTAKHRLFVSADRIRKNDFEIPQARPLNNGGFSQAQVQNGSNMFAGYSAQPQANQGDLSEFEEIISDGTLPF